MFNQIGRKIKTLAKVVCWAGIVLSVLVPLIMYISDAIDEDMIFMVLLMMVGGSLASWIGSFFVYGFGELIDKSAEISNNTRK